MNRLKHCTDTSHTSVNMGIGEEVRGQVAVKPSLNCGRSVYPKRRVEQDVVQKLPCQERLAERLISIDYRLSDDW